MRTIVNALILLAPMTCAALSGDDIEYVGVTGVGERIYLNYDEELVGGKYYGYFSDKTNVRYKYCWNYPRAGNDDKYYYFSCSSKGRSFPEAVYRGYNYTAQDHAKRYKQGEALFGKYAGKKGGSIFEYVDCLSGCTKYHAKTLYVISYGD